MDISRLKEDFSKKSQEIRRLKTKIPRYFAGAAEKMIHLNFTLQGFVSGGKIQKRWPKRKRETTKSAGKRVLSSTGYLEENVKAKALSDHIRVGVDLGVVPYAKIHNEGGRITQYVKPHHRVNRRSGKRHQVRGFSRRINMPARKYLGYVPDIEVIAGREIKSEIDRVFRP